MRLLRNRQEVKYWIDRRLHKLIDPDQATMLGDLHELLPVTEASEYAQRFAGRQAAITCLEDLRECLFGKRMPEEVPESWDYPERAADRGLEGRVTADE